MVPFPCILPAFHELKKQVGDINAQISNPPFSQHSSLAFCPAESTTSKGRGANEDQYSCFATAISAQIPERSRNTMILDIQLKEKAYWMAHGQCEEKLFLLCSFFYFLAYDVHPMERKA